MTSDIKNRMCPVHESEAHCQRPLPPALHPHPLGGLLMLAAAFLFAVLDGLSKLLGPPFRLEIAVTLRHLSVRKERFAPGGKVYLRASAPFHGKHCNEMGNTLDRNDNQGTGASLSLAHGRDHSSGPGIGATSERLFQTRPRFVSKRRNVLGLCLCP